MKKIILFLIIFALLFSLSACSQNQEEEAAASSTGDAGQTEEKEGAVPEDEPLQDEEGETEMKIRVEADGNTILFALNDSQAAQDLYDQLPLQIEVENYSSNEKIFYPPEELDVSDAPQAGGGAGTLAYYQPWGDVVMFYGDFSPSGGLYGLGEAVSGTEYISGISGTVTLEAEE